MTKRTKQRTTKLTVGQAYAAVMTVLLGSTTPRTATAALTIALGHALAAHPHPRPLRGRTMKLVENAGGQFLDEKLRWT